VIYAENRSFNNLFANMLDKVIGLMAKYKLGATTETIIDSTISGSNEPSYRWLANGNIQWLYWELYVNWTEETTVTIS
jgi:hypothetical protein